MKYGLKIQDWEKIFTVFHGTTPLEEVILYGSRAIGNFKNGSDIDLALKGDNLNLRVLNKIANDLDDLLLPYTFDLLIFNHINHQNLIQHINDVGIHLWKR